MLPPILIGGAVLAAIGLIAAHANRDRSLGAIALAGGLAVLLLTPAVASVATAAEPHTGAIPTAVPTAQNARGGPGGPGGFGGQGGFRGGRAFGGPPGGGGFGGFAGGRGGNLGGLLDAREASSALVAALRENAGAYRWTAATTGSNNAAGLALSSET